MAKPMNPRLLKEGRYEKMHRDEMKYYEMMHPETRPPSIGVTGFWLTIVGIIVPFMGLAGFICCIVAFVKAKREGRRVGGLATAGLVIGVWGMLSMMVFLTRL